MTQIVIKKICIKKCK